MRLPSHLSLCTCHSALARSAQKTDRPRCKHAASFASENDPSPPIVDGGLPFSRKNPLKPGECRPGRSLGGRLRSTRSKGMMVLVYITAWLAISAWAGTLWLRKRCPRQARLLWTVGALSLFSHWSLAFHIVHGWDHEHAAATIAEETYRRSGVKWDGGIYVNHAFTLIWLLDAAAWWIAPRCHQTRSRWLEGLVQFIFLFMFFNATVVFGSGLAVPVGLILCSLAIWALVFVPRSQVFV